MRKFGYLAGGSALAMAMALGAASAASAQAQPTQVDEVVITGSLIAGSAEDAALPVDVISAEDLSRQGSPTTVELLKTLSVSSGVLGDTNQFDPRAQGSEGSGSVNLRGLGAQRTLVLLNGKRIAINPFGQAGAGIVDTNMIPSAAVGRVEVLKDGAAATYGSDAIAGVVNFITKTNFEGFEVSASYRNIDGSEGDYTGSAVWGWSGDNANVLLTAGVQRRSQLAIPDRSWASSNFWENPQGGWSGGNAQTVIVTLGATPFSITGSLIDPGCVPLGGVISGGACNFHYTPYDNIVEIEDRFQLYGEINVDVTDTTKFHLEMLYGETQVPEWHTSPSYLTLQQPTSIASGGTTPSLPGGYYVPTSNPGVTSNIFTPAQMAASTSGFYLPGVRYRPLSTGGNPMFPSGSSEGSREYSAFRISGGLKGEFGNGVTWDASLTYSTEKGYRSGYDSVVPRLQLALRGYGSKEGDANACTAADTANYTTNAGNTALGCYYFNPFSNAVQSNNLTGAVNPLYQASTANNTDVIRWFFQSVWTEQTSKLTVADVVFTGKTGITLAGGEVAWALGGQVRREQFESAYSSLSDGAVNPCINTPFNGSTTCTTRNGPLAFLGTGSESSLSSDAYAVFGELAVPVTDDFQLQLAARYEDYGGDVGSTFDPKISARWQVTDWIALRGSAGTTFRGPPQTSLATGSVTALSFIGGSFRAIDIFGNPNLEPESAKTYSLGFIVKAGGLKASVDWWKFDFENPIIAEPSASIVSAMFGAGSNANCGNPAYAGLLSRFNLSAACASVANPLTLINRVRTQVVNGPAVSTSGYDFLVDYDFGEVLGGDLRLGSSITYTSEYKVDAFVVEGITVQTAFDAVGLLNYQLGPTSLPQLKGSAFVEYTRGPHNIRWTINYIDEYEDQRTTPFTAPVTYLNPTTGVSTTVTIPAGKTIEKFVTHELDYRVLLPWNTTVVASIDNVFDEDPPFARLDLNYDPFTASGLGRTWKLSVTKKF